MTKLCTLWSPIPRIQFVDTTSTESSAQCARRVVQVNADCTSAIDLGGKTTVKAQYRRAQARTELDELTGALQVSTPFNCPNHD